VHNAAVRRATRRLIPSDTTLARVSLAWFLANLAEWAFITALAIHEFSLHGALAVGLVGARFAPGALAGPVLLAVLARRHPPLILQFLALSRCLTAGAASLAVATHAPLSVLIAVVWVDAIIAAPYRPVQAAILPAIAGTPRELAAAAGSIPASKALAQAAGALVGSVLLAATSSQAAVAAAVVLFFATSALVAPVGVGITLLPGSAAAGGGSGADSPGATGRPGGTVREGFGLVVQRARALLVLGGARSLTRGLWSSLTVVASLRLLHLGSAGVGLLMAAAGVGAAISVPLALRFAGRPRLGGPAAVAFAFAGLPITLLGAAAEPVSAVALATIWGLAFALADSLSNALIHRVVDARRLAPAVAALESSKLLLEGLGALAAPGLLLLVGIRDAVMLAGAPLTLMILFSRRPLLRIDARAEARTRPLAALRATPSFRGLTMLSLESLAARLRPLAVGEGEVIIREGEPGDRFYVIDTGKVEVSIDGFAVAALGAGGSFGEKALLRRTTRSATVTAVEPTELWCLEGPDFIAGVTDDEVLVARPGPRRGGSTIEETLAEVPLSAAIDRHGLAQLGELRTEAAGEAVVTEGEAGDRFYVLLEGEATVAVGGRTVRTLHAGDCFGEIALLHNVPRQATVRAVESVRLWSIERDAFLSILGGTAPSARTPAPLALGGPEIAGAGLIV
jgi:CRP-like cAMP-binding protein